MERYKLNSEEKLWMIIIFIFFASCTTCHVFSKKDPIAERISECRFSCKHMFKYDDNSKICTCDDEKQQH